MDECNDNYVNYCSKIFILVAAVGSHEQLIPQTESNIEAFLNQFINASKEDFPLQGFNTKTDKKVLEIQDDRERNINEDFKEKEYSKLPLKVLLKLAKYFGGNKKIAIEDARVFIANPDPAVFRNIFNLSDIRIVKTMRRIILLDKIKTNIKFYLSQEHLDDLFEFSKIKPLMLKEKYKSGPITFSRDMLIPSDLAKKRSDPDTICIRLVSCLSLMSLKQRLSCLSSTEIIIEDENDSNDADSQTFRTALQKNGFYFSSPQSEVLPSQKLTHTLSGSSQISHPNLLSSLSAAQSRNTNNLASRRSNHLKFAANNLSQEAWLTPVDALDFRRILIHIHGGGFVAMSSSSHLTYLIKWANELKVPVFSIDYRLAPVVQYPILLNDVIRSYIWILVK